MPAIYFISPSCINGQKAAQVNTTWVARKELTDNIWETEDIIMERMEMQRDGSYSNIIFFHLLIMSHRLWWDSALALAKT